MINGEGHCILMKTSKERLKKFFEDFIGAGVLIFLYAPILVMMVLSFQQLEIEIPVGRVHVTVV